MLVRPRIVLSAWLLLPFLLFATVASAQQLEAQVETDLRTLPIDKQQKLREFADRVMHYINSYRWTDDPWRTKVMLQVQLILEDRSTNAEDRYAGQILIHNNYDLQFFDKRWSYTYMIENNLQHQENGLDSFTSVVDFYIYLILGGEFDKWSTLGGQVYFEKAKSIAEQAKFGMGRFIEGWDRRLDLVNYLLGDRHRPYREMVDYYFYGLSFIREDNARARQHCATAISMLDKIITNDPENEYAKKFVDAHYMEMVEIFRRANNKDPLRTLMVIDPGHAQIYRDILNN
ncbi:MAG: hypothetical protein BWY83_00611 [bacterium ADurb.Bin478]|nr:MAG: hypothetical protein BWY83_00611 [bacterium ADurb.Bin478]